MKNSFKILTCTIVIVLFLLTLLITATNIVYRNPTDWFKCLKDGGDYIENIDYLVSGKKLFHGEGYICKYTYIDGEKECFSNDDCMGVCLVTKDTIIVKSETLSPKVIGGSGKCSSTNYFPGVKPGDFDFPIEIYF